MLESSVTAMCDVLKESMMEKNSEAVKIQNPFT